MARKVQGGNKRAKGKGQKDEAKNATTAAADKVQYKFKAPQWQSIPEADVGLPVVERVVQHVRRNRKLVVPTAKAPARKIVAYHEEEEDELKQPAHAHTTNGAVQFSESGNPVLDLFFSAMVRGCPAETVERLMAAAWKEEPKLALQVLLNGRDCRGGKGEKAVVYTCMLWLRQHAPVTYALNLRRFLDLGYYKDLVTLTSSLAPHTPTLFLPSTPSDPAVASLGAASGYNGCVDECLNDVVELEVLAEDLRADMLKLGLVGQEQDMLKEPEEKKSAVQTKVQQEEASATTEEDREDWEMVDAILSNKPVPQPSPARAPPTLEEEQLMKQEDTAVPAPVPALVTPASPVDAAVPDVKEQEQEQKGQDNKGRPPKAKHISVSLAAKWAPTEKGSADRHSAVAKRLARLLFPQAGKGALSLYRKAIGSVRSHVMVVEKLMCEGRWDEISFGSVPSKAHRLLKAAFAKHQPERYNLYKSALAAGTEKINTAGLQPHELVAEYLTQRKPMDPVVEAQWVTLVSKLKQSGKLSSCVSVVDVSGSMTGVPMEVAITLGLITSELTTGPFAHRVITFHSNPTWHHVQEGTLHDQVVAMKAAPWGGSTNLQKTFDLILQHAVATQAPQQDMPKTLFIYSDMQFDTACRDNSATNFKEMKLKYERAGYTPPQVVFWNLNGTPKAGGVPVTVHDTGVAMLSGFSAQLLKVFMDEVDFTPMGVLRAAVGKYECEVDEQEAALATAGTL